MEPAPECPELGALELCVIQAYDVVARGRRYAPSGHPLPLSLGEVNAYVNVYPIIMPRDWFDAAVFALDDAVCAAIWSNDDGT